MDALAEDLPKGSNNQTDFALQKLGPKAIPALMPLLEQQKTAAAAIRMIKLMGDSITPFQSAWSKTANDTKAPVAKRLAALRAISALGFRGRSSASAIEALSSSPEFQLREQAGLTLEAIRSFEATPSPQAQDVSIIRLLANPLKYDGKQVQIIGFLRLEFEGNAIYLHRDDFEYGISKNGLWMDRPQDFSKEQAARVNTKYVICSGTFKATEHGHMGMFSGSLTRITRIEPWGPWPRD